METTEQAIRIEGKTLRLRKDGTILVYDQANKAYAPMSYEEIFAKFEDKQKKAINQLNEQNEQLKKERENLEREIAEEKAALSKMQKDFADEIRANVGDFESRFQARYDDFIKKYQDSMSTLTQLVKAAIKE